MKKLESYCDFQAFVVEVPSRVELLYTVLQTVT